MKKERYIIPTGAQLFARYTKSKKTKEKKESEQSKVSKMLFAKLQLENFKIKWLLDDSLPYLLKKALLNYTNELEEKLKNFSEIKPKEVTMDKLKDKMLEAIDGNITPYSGLKNLSPKRCIQEKKLAAESCTELTASVAIGYRNWWMELGAAGRLKLIASLPQIDSKREAFDYYIENIHNFQ